MSTIKSLFEHKKAVILANRDPVTKKSTVYLYNLIDKTIKKYEPVGENLNWEYRAVARKDADLSGRLANESLVYDGINGVNSAQVVTELRNYYCHLVINGEIKLCVDPRMAYLPDGRDAKGSANCITYGHSAPTNSTPHGIVLFTLERYQHILHANETIKAIMNLEI